MSPFLILYNTIIQSKFFNSTYHIILIVYDEYIYIYIFTCISKYIMNYKHIYI